MRPLIFLLLSMTALPLSAATYKWVDEKGVTQYGDTIPPQYVNRGVTEINKKGLVIKKTEPALTAEQLRRQAAEIAEKKVMNKRAEELRRRDVSLMGTYTAEPEIDLVRDRNTQQIDVTVRSAEEKIANGQARLAEIGKELEFFRGKDKNGNARVPPAELVQEKEQVRKDESMLKAAIGELEKQKLLVASRFEDDKVRFREIKAAGVGSAAAAGAGAKAERTAVPFAINAGTTAIVNDCMARWSAGGRTQAIAAQAIQHDGETDLVVDGRAADKKGQLTTRRFVCPMTAEGKIDPRRTEVKKVLASLGAQF